MKTALLGTVLAFMLTDAVSSYLLSCNYQWPFFTLLLVWPRNCPTKEVLLRAGM